MLRQHLISPPSLCNMTGCGCVNFRQITCCSHLNPYSNVVTPLELHTHLEGEHHWHLLHLWSSIFHLGDEHTGILYTSGAPCLSGR